MPETVKNHFRLIGFGTPEEAQLKNVKCCFYPKQKFNSVNSLRSGNNYMYLAGTCFMKGKKYREGLENILKDYVSGSLDTESLAGSYFILFGNEKLTEFYSDPAAIQNIFFHRRSGIISSSFIACMLGAYEVSGKLKINKDACTEILTTGTLAGPDTLFCDIERYEPSFHDNLPGINRIITGHKIRMRPQRSTFDSEVNYQVEKLKEFIEGLKPAMDEMGVLTGLTGGFDSRLLFHLLRLTTQNISVYSTYRKNPTEEYKCAEKLADFYNFKLVSPGYRLFSEMDRDEFRAMMVDNLLFNDGQVRLFNLWTEEIKSKSYLESLYGNRLIGMSGVGGEQYRNGEYLTRDNYKFSDWFYAEMILKYCKDPFIHKEMRRKFLDFIRNKMFISLKKEGNSEYISRAEIKKYLGTVYNTSCRTLRNNIENQLFFFISPFTDYFISMQALDCLPFLGNHHDFEKTMIQELAPESAFIRLDYGYRISDNVPVRYRFLPAVKRITGIKNYYRMKSIIRPDDALSERIFKAHPFMKSYSDAVRELMLPVSVDTILKSNHLSPLVLELGLFVKHFENLITVV